MIKPGDKFRLKKTVTLTSLNEIHYHSDYGKVLLDKKEIIAIETPKEYKDKYHDKVWFYFTTIGGNCYLNPEMVELVAPKETNHPLTKMFARKE